MPRVGAASWSSCANAVSCSPGMKNASSQPYPVTASSGRHSTVTPWARASAIAAARCARLSSHASGVWLTHATATLTSLMAVLAVEDQMLGQERCGAVDLEKCALQGDRAGVAVGDDDPAEQPAALDPRQRVAREQPVGRDRIDRPGAGIAVGPGRAEQRPAGP